MQRLSTKRYIGMWVCFQNDFSWRKVMNLYIFCSARNEYFNLELLAYFSSHPLDCFVVTGCWNQSHIGGWRHAWQGKLRETTTYISATFKELSLPFSNKCHNSEKNPKMVSGGQYLRVHLRKSSFLTRDSCEFLNNFKIYNNRYTEKQQTPTVN